MLALWCFVLALFSGQAKSLMPFHWWIGDARGKVIISDWAVAHDRTNLISYIRTYGDLLIQKTDHKTIDFDQPDLRTIELQNDFMPEDITSKAQPLAAAYTE